MSRNNQAKILMVYIEPTPYILGLLDALIPIWNGKVDVLFLGENRSQNWDIPMNKQWMMLPRKKSKKIRFIVQLLFNGQYHMIHIAGWGEPLCLLFIFIAKLMRLPVSVESDTPTPHYTKLWKRAIKRLFYPALFRLVNLFLPGGTRQAKYLEHYSVKPQRIVPVKMTVDIIAIKKFTQTLTPIDRQFIRNRLEIPKNNIAFLYVGRLEAHKGIGDLISAFNEIKNENASLLIVGDGSMRQQINEEVNKNAKIRYAGRLSEKKLIETYYAVDVLVLPSHFEPWGLVVNEAMAASRPVIVSDRVGCIDDLVVHKKNGLIVKAEDRKELQSAIEYMAYNINEVEKMGKKSAELIADWTLENEAKNICQAWNRLIYI